MTKKNFQQLGIWIIAIALTIGTIGSFVAIVLANENQQTDTSRFNELNAEYQKEYSEYEAKLDAQGKELSAIYYPEFSQYKDAAAAFDAASVSGLVKRDLKEGTGEVITGQSKFAAYYIGWNPKGEVFDSSFEDDALKSPIIVMSGSVIQGWTDGLDGIKVGGIRELTIPSALAYGEQGSGDKIPANTPLKFIVMVIPTPEDIPQPTPSEELLEYYYKQQQQ